MANKLIYGSYITTCVRSNLYQRKCVAKSRQRQNEQARERERAGGRERQAHEEEPNNFIVCEHTFGE